MSSVFETFHARLLGPLTYHTVPDAGAAGATVTAPFLGDTALTYAVHYALHGHALPNRFGPRGPGYAVDYKLFRTICSVGWPVGPVQMLAPEYVASSFMSEGFEQKKISTMDSKHRRSGVSNTPYRPWRQIQSLAPTHGQANIFGFSAVSKRALPATFTVRMGLGRGTLVRADKVEVASACAVNRFTVERLLGRSMTNASHTSITSPLAQFQIHHGVPAETALELLAPVA